MTNPYDSPEDFELEPVGTISWPSYDYGYDMTAVWVRNIDGRLVYADDSGCSCPSPFEELEIEDLTVLPGRGDLAALQAHLEKRDEATRWIGGIDTDEPYDAARSPMSGQIVALIERAYSMRGTTRARPAAEAS